MCCKGVRVCYMHVRSGAPIGDNTAAATAAASLVLPLLLPLPQPLLPLLVLEAPGPEREQLPDDAGQTPHLHKLGAPGPEHEQS